jgi:hypothetical protein
MTYKEIANRITGVGCPIFSVSWNPPKFELDIAYKVVTYLEDRRVLYNPYELEVPEHCIQSVGKIREFLTQTLFDVEPNSELGLVLRTMRAACRKFLDTTTHDERSAFRHSMGMGDQFKFDSNVGELRGAFGVQLARLLVLHGIDCEGDLLTILPGTLD